MPSALLAEVWRSGQLATRITLEFSSLSIQSEINSLDRAEFIIPTLACVIEADILKFYDGPMFIGEFLVTRVEPALASDGMRVNKASAVARAHLLNQVALPREGALVGTSTADMFALLRQLTFEQTGQVITFTPFNLGNDSAEGVTPQARGGLEVIREIAQATGYRWRSRPDLGAEVQWGLFGDVRPVYLLPARGTSDYREQEAAGQFTFSALTPLHENTEVADALIPEGGKWTDGNGVERTLTLEFATPPAGFEIEPRIFLGRTAYTLKKTGTTPKSYRDMIAGNIVPTGEPPGTAEVAQAATSLALVASRYLANTVSMPLRSYGAPLPYTLSGMVVVGDKVTLNADTNPNSATAPCDGTISGQFYVVRFTREWRPDGTRGAQLELSTRLDSISDPLSDAYGSEGREKRVTNAPATFIVSGTANPTTTIPFGQTFAVAPFVSPLQNGGCSITINSVTVSDVTVTVVPAPCDVKIAVFPQ